MDGEHRISSAEQHDAAAVEIDIAGAAHFSFAAQRGADLLDDVSCQAGFVAIDLRHSSLEPDDDFGAAARRNDFAKIHSERRALVVERGEERRVVLAGAYFDDVEPGFVRLRDWSDLFASAQVRVKMKIEDGASFFAPIYPAHSFN